MNQQWRRNIKKAAKAGVEVEHGTASDLKAFHELYAHTAERDHFTPRPLGYFETMFESLGAEEPDRIRLYLARHEGDLVAATIWIRVGAHSWYSYGASSTEKRDVRGSNAVQWQMIRDALAAGAHVYDLRGITATLDADDSHVGLIQFKVGTGGEAVEYAGEWDLPLSKPAVRRLRPLHEAPGVADGLDLVRRRRPLAHASQGHPVSEPRAGAGRQGQRLRLRPAPARPQGRLAGRRHPGRRHLRRAAPRQPAVRRVAARAHPVAPVRPGPGRRPPGHPHRRTARGPRGPGRAGQVDRPPTTHRARADDLDAAPRLHRA